MKKAIAILLLLSMLLSLCACAPAPAEKPEEQPGKSPDTAEPMSPDPEPVTPDPATATPDPTKGEDGAGTGDNDIKEEKTVFDLYDEFLAAPVVVPDSFQVSFPSYPENAPETADGLYFSCRNANLYISSSSTVHYTFYVLSEKPVDENKFDFKSGLRAQTGYSFEEVFLEGYKENAASLYSANEYHCLASTADWKQFAWLMDKYMNSERDSDTFVYFHKYETFVRNSEKEAARSAYQWSRELPKFYAYKVEVTFSGTAVSETTDTVTIAVKGKQYKVNCGCIRAGGDSQIRNASSLAYGGGVMAAGVNPYAHEIVREKDSNLIIFQAMDNITVLGLEVEDGSGKLRVEDINLTINRSDGKTENVDLEEGDAFSMFKGDRVRISCKLYDSDAVGIVYTGNYMVRVKYKTVDGKTEYAGRDLYFGQRTNLYQLYLSFFQNVDFGPLYEYVMFPFHVSSWYRTQHYKPVPGGNQREEYLLLREFFGVA
ncbi:MAG: hypothetical protein II794_03690 [Oscillospiraceae bacterium]|nr:hypothetical protein [Oscillospiraceae bacterium]